jgi:hypothetical protein
MICINVLAIFIDINLMERISLLTVNILLHFQLIHQVSWMVPHNGDSIPKTSRCQKTSTKKKHLRTFHIFSVIYYRNSLVITCALLLESLIVQSISSSERPPFQWINKVFLVIRNKQFDFMFFGSKQDENNDENNLIDAKQIENSSNKKLWRDFSSFIDKLTLIIVAIVYAIMCFTLIPMRYGKISNPLIVS